jgi:CBS domain-containing protein
LENSASERKKETVANLYRYSDLSVKAIAQQVDMEPVSVQSIVDVLAKDEALQVLVDQSLGRIEKIMNTDVVSLDGEKTAQEAAALMAKKKVGSVVVTENEKPFGIISHSDIVKLAGMQEKPSGAKLKDVASRPLITAGRNTTIESATETLITNKIHKLPVVDGDRLVGMVTITDLAGFLSPSRRPGLALSVLRAIAGERAGHVG